MAPKKRVKHSSSMPHSRTVVATAAMTGSVDLPVGQGLPEGRLEGVERGGGVGAGLGPGEVDDVVGQASQRVDGVDVAA